MVFKILPHFCYFACLVLTCYGKIHDKTNSISDSVMIKIEDVKSTDKGGQLLESQDRRGH